MDKAHAHVGLKANCRALRFSRRPSPRGHGNCTEFGQRLAVSSRERAPCSHDPATGSGWPPHLRDELPRGTPAEERLDFPSPNSKTFLLQERQRGLPEEHLRATNWSVGVLADPSASLLVVDSGTSSCSLKQLRVPRGEGLQSSAMSETLPPHLSGLQQTAVPALVQHGVVIEHE